MLNHHDGKEVECQFPGQTLIIPFPPSKNLAQSGESAKNLTVFTSSRHFNHVILSTCATVLPHHCRFTAAMPVLNCTAKRFVCRYTGSLKRYCRTFAALAYFYSIAALLRIAILLPNFGKSTQHCHMSATRHCRCIAVFNALVYYCCIF